MGKIKYLMENDEEAIRLDLKTDISIIEKQALWAGIKPGMRIADIGCGPGKITSTLYKLASPGGTAVGVDGSKTRLDYAKKHYSNEGVEFVCKDILEPLDDIGTFDFVWIRFVLEYYRDNAPALLQNIDKILKPGGVLMLLDLDHNPLNHYGFPERLSKTLSSMLEILEKKHNFDPYIGRKLYSYTFDLGYENIDVDVSTNTVVFGQLKEIDYYNWLKKVETAVQKFSDYNFTEYKHGYEEFIEEYKSSMNDPRRFSYTPLICCRGQKPVTG